MKVNLVKVSLFLIFLFFIEVNCFSQTEVLDTAHEDFKTEENLDSNEKLEAEEKLDSENIDVENLSEAAEKEPEIKIEYETIVDESNRLHVHFYKDQNVEFIKTSSDAVSKNRTLTFSSKNRLRRFSYDSDLRLSSVEIWNCGEKASATKLKSVTYYSYDSADETYVSKEYDVEKNTLSEILFNSYGNPLSKTVSAFINVEDGDKIYQLDYSKPKRKEFVFTYKYDSEQHLIQEEELHIEYFSPDSTAYKKSTARKNVYKYTKFDCPPDYVFYENGILRMNTIYISQKEYVQYVYFDQETYVKVQYKNGKKKSEIFYKGNDELYKNDYE